MERPKLIVFASGTKDGGGSGVENLGTSKERDADIVAVVSNHEHGGLRERAERLGIPFVYMPPPYDAEHYRNVLDQVFAENAPKNGSAISGLTPRSQSDFTGWVALSGWMKHVVGLDPARTFHIHPALLSQLDHRFGGS